MSDKKKFPSNEEIKVKYKLEDSWGNTSHPDECYKQGLQDMYEVIMQEIKENYYLISKNFLL